MFRILFFKFCNIFLSLLRYSGKWDANINMKFTIFNILQMHIFSHNLRVILHIFSVPLFLTVTFHTRPGVKFSAYGIVLKHKLLQI